MGKREEMMITYRDPDGTIRYTDEALMATAAVAAEHIQDGSVNTVSNVLLHAFVRNIQFYGGSLEAAHRALDTLWQTEVMLCGQKETKQ